MALNKATFAGGCFWCTEAVFARLIGVDKVVSGYTGGFIKNPPYREVCTGRTGHAEAVQVYYDDVKILYQDLLNVFFATHDPTTLNRQGNDVGTQYRSAIFCHSDMQKQMAEQFIKRLEAQKVFDAPIVTEINDSAPFYKAEIEHQDYYANNEQQPYCQYIIAPKLNKLSTLFKDQLKQE